MKLSAEIKDEIINNLKKNRDVKNVILFGSYAYGNPRPWSDIDLLVLLNVKGFTGSFRKKIEMKGKISGLLVDVMKKVPVDLLVYTVDEWNYLLSKGFCFHKEISDKGVRIL